jgi:hypothetical protein
LSKENKKLNQGEELSHNKKLKDGKMRNHSMRNKSTLEEMMKAHVTKWKWSVSSDGGWPQARRASKRAKKSGWRTSVSSATTPQARGTRTAAHGEVMDKEQKLDCLLLLLFDYMHYI